MLTDKLKEIARNILSPEACLTHQCAAKGRQRSKWKGRFLTSMCSLYSCTDHCKGRGVRKRAPFQNLNLGSSYVKQRTTSSSSKSWSLPSDELRLLCKQREAKGTPLEGKCPFLEKRNQALKQKTIIFVWFNLCATHTAPRHKCLLRRTTSGQG